MTDRKNTRTPNREGAWEPFPPGYSDLSPDQLRALVERGHALRARYFAEMFARWAREWRSVFRGPGRLLPRGSGGAQPQTH